MGAFSHNRGGLLQQRPPLGLPPGVPPSVGISGPPQGGWGPPKRGGARNPSFGGLQKGGGPPFWKAPNFPPSREAPKRGSRPPPQKVHLRGPQANKVPRGVGPHKPKNPQKRGFDIERPPITPKRPKKGLFALIWEPREAPGKKLERARKEMERKEVFFGPQAPVFPPVYYPPFQAQGRNSNSRKNSKRLTGPKKPLPKRGTRPPGGLALLSWEGKLNPRIQAQNQGKAPQKRKGPGLIRKPNSPKGPESPPFQGNSRKKEGKESQGRPREGVFPGPPGVGGRRPRPGSSPRN